MATVRRIEKAVDRIVDVMECGSDDCQCTFIYVGFPNFCPECGAEFDETEEKP